MLRKSIIAIAALATFLMLHSVECFDLERKHGVKLSCWPYPVVPVDFKVSFYFSSRMKKNVRSTAKTTLGTDLDFNPNRRTAVIVHGYGSNGQADGMNSLRDALLQWEDMNVIVLDWQNGSSSLIYPQVAANTVKAAIALKDLIVRLARLIKKPFEEWKPVHLIGHSIGAHVVGQVGALLKEKHNLIVDRITGLDPAEPCFDDPSSHLRLKKTNARFVDVVHTDAARKKNERFGLRDALAKCGLPVLGHADFYVNGGSKQPGCPAFLHNNDMKKTMKNNDAAPPKTLEEILKYKSDIALHVLNGGICHHTRALEVFIHSIIQARENACRLWAHLWSLKATKSEISRIVDEQCNEHNCIEMGINAEKYRDRLEASYYVKTTATAPYCVKQD